MLKMPTAQQTNTSNKPKTKNVDNKIAKAAAKVNSGEENRTRTSSLTQEQGGQQPQQTSSGNKTPQEHPEFIKQSLTIIEKKVRNLEKRKTKLEEYRDIQAKGTVLNEDQLSAVSKFDEVLRTLELTRELEKQFIQLANDALKQQKKQSKKEQIEREEAIREKLKESQKILSLLNTFGEESVRNDFLNEKNGAFKLTEQEMNALDEFNKLVQPQSEINPKIDALSAESADHIYYLIEGRNKQVTQLNQEAVGVSMTYADFKKLFDRILGSPYWNRTEAEKNAAATAATATQEPFTEPKNANDSAVPESNVETLHLNDQMNNLNMNVEHQGKLLGEQNDTHSNLPLEQIYHQQNTSEDYILVSSSDYNENAQKSQQVQQQQQQQQNSKTFFSTLNPQDPNNRNINEFLNRCENNDDGINFLQDSEIQLAPHEQHQQQQPHQHEQHHQQLEQQQQHHQHHQQHHEADQYHHQQAQNQNFSNYQEYVPNEADTRGGPRPLRDYTNSGQQRNNYQPRPRYQDDYRGPPRDQRGPMGPRGNGMLNQPPRNNGNDKNGSSAYRGGNNRSGNGGGFRSGGGGSGGYAPQQQQQQSAGGPRGGPGAGGSGGQRYPPRQTDNRPQVIQN